MGAASLYHEPAVLTEYEQKRGRLEEPVTGVNLPPADPGDEVNVVA